MAVGVGATTIQGAEVTAKYIATKDMNLPPEMKRELQADAALTVVSAIATTVGAVRAARVAPQAAGLEKAPKLTPEQAANLARFAGTFRKGIEPSVESLEGGGARFQAEVPGKVPGSKAVYEKVVDPSGKTVSMTKTTIDPKGEVVHVKDKL